MFCTVCGHQKQEEHARFCAHCGADGIPREVLPAGIRGWSWGAFLLSWIWALGNRTFIGLLALLPWVGFIVAIWLGMKGREMAWKNDQWDDVEHFNRVQRKWTQWGIGITAVMSLSMIMLVFSVLGSGENDITPFSQELLEAISSNSDSTDATSEQDEECSTDNEQ